MVATLNLPLEQGPTESDSAILVPAFPLPNDVADLRLALDAKEEEIAGAAALLVGYGYSGLAAVCLAR